MIKQSKYVDIDGEKVFKEDIQKISPKDFKLLSGFLEEKDLEKIAKWWDSANPDSYFCAVGYLQELQR